MFKFGAAFIVGGLLAASSTQAQTSSQQAPPLENQKTITGLSAGHILDFAAKASAAGDYETAEKAYKAVIQDPNPDLRNEARWRLSTMLQSQKKNAEAAILLRRILDETPNAPRVRLELAKLLFTMGDDAGARRELRAAQAGDLPPEVARIVEFFSSALRSRKPVGASLEIAIAPDSNINRATRDDTLDTIIAPLELSDDAKAQSGIGVTIGAQAYARTPIDDNWKLLVRASGRGSFYRKNAYNDVSASLQVGTEWQDSKNRVAPSIGHSRRWFGGRHYATTNVISASWQHQIGKRAQLEIASSIGFSDYKNNDLQDGVIYDFDIALDRALSPVTGVRAGITGQRQTARDPGYATASGGLSLLGWHQFGRTSVFASAQVRRLEADARIFLYPQRRRETYFSIGAGATFRQFSYKSFAPLIRVQYERNASTVGLYDYDRMSVNLGISRAF